MSLFSGIKNIANLASVLGGKEEKDEDTKKQDGNLLSAVLAGKTQQQPQGGVGGYDVGQTPASNYMPSLWRPVEKIAGLVKTIATGL